MKPQASLRKLRILVKSLQQRFPSPWSWQALSRKEVLALGILDPPCAMVTGTCGPFYIDIHADGEGYVGFRTVEGGNYSDVFPRNSYLDLSLTCNQIVSDLVSLLQHWGSERNPK